MLLAVHSLTGMACLHFGYLLTNNNLGKLRWGKLPKNSWLILGLFFSFCSHAIIDVIGTMYTYHPIDTYESIFSTLFYVILSIIAIIIIFLALKKDKIYAYGITFAMIFDIWDHLVIKWSNCILNSFEKGCSDVNSGILYNLQLHNFEWELLHLFFEGVERHNHKEIFVLVEIITLALMTLLVLFLQKRIPIIK